MFKIGSKPLFYVKECNHYFTKLEDTNTIDKLKVKNKLDYDILNVTVFQNLSSAQTETDISDFPIIHQTNGIIVFKC